ncbi:MAG: hypothetical protein K0R26_2573 [Bacteroidota bacterium]|jgi:hypothetical protein|nr:hypothetical protein [Bacteroidota bacterium]
MKKIYSVLALCSLGYGASAQQLQKPNFTAIHPTTSAWNVSTDGASKVAVTNTLMPATMMGSGCGTNTANVVYYSNFGTAATTDYTLNAVGYLFGTNRSTYVLSPANATALGTPTLTSETTKLAQKYNVTGNVSVTQILIANAIGEGAGTVGASIYSENTTTKKPNTQIGSTSTLALSSMTGYDAVTFTSPIAVSSGNFFAAVEVPTIGGSNLDSLAVLSTSFGCSSTDTLSWIFNTVAPAQAAFVLPSGWMSVKMFAGNTTADNLDLLIFPVVDITTSLSSISRGNLTLLAAFPNPANNEISINFSLNQSSKVEIEIYDVTGKIVNVIKMDNLASGKHSTKINTENLNSGVYLYSVKSENAKMFSKFTISK